MRHVIIVLPTYNEKENIELIIHGIEVEAQKLKNTLLSVLVVDDSSPDGTAAIVTRLQKHYPNIYLLQGEKNGLGAAYIRGFVHAITVLKADIVFEMDADLSHNPRYIPLFLEKMHQGYDFVIGSRYIPEGSIPSDWSLLRKLNSWVGNILTRTIVGLHFKDCTSGYRAISVSLLKKINLEKLLVKGYAFQISLLHQAQKQKGRIAEIPIHFTDRVHGKSKIRLADISEFIFSCFYLRFPILYSIKHNWTTLLSGILFLCLLSLAFQFSVITFILHNVLLIFLFSLAILLTIFGGFTWIMMMYAWENAEEVEKHKSPADYEKPSYSFTALVPARHEDKVINDTICAIDNIEYPDRLKELIIICKHDDIATIQEVKATIKALGKNNIKLLILEGKSASKPHSLNVGLAHATKDIIVVFDAEDEPHTNIYQVINTLYIQKKVDIIQSGIQLMNYNSHWFSLLNILEYYFWFKSGLLLFSKIGIIPLGGNSVFFKKTLLQQINGWDEHCLTEDADIGIRLSLLGAKIDILYDEQHATQEETPSSVKGFIKQRTRWNQGFLQIFLKREWMKLPTLSQRIIAIYLLIGPQIGWVLFSLIPLSLLTIFTLKIPILFAMFINFPLFLLVLIIVTLNIGFYHFIKDYKLKYPLFSPLIIILTFFPYQALLAISAIRAGLRLAKKKNAWEKTLHINAHRNMGKRLSVKASVKL